MTYGNGNPLLDAETTLVGWTNRSAIRGHEHTFVALFCQECRLQLGEGQGLLFGVIGFELFGQLADGGGELLGLDAQLPQGTGALESAGRTCRLRC